MDSKLVTSFANQPSELPATMLGKDQSNDAAITEPASSKPNSEDELVRPFVYRAPVGKSSGTEPSHLRRRSSDMESGGN